MNFLTKKEQLRYNRQIILKNFDLQGQKILKDSSVLIVGLGGIGCSTATWLVCSGIGKITLLDFDLVSQNNLQRQILYRDTTLGMLKVDSAQKILQSLNNYCQINTISERLSNDKLNYLIKHQNAVLDCTDNIESREQLNVLCYFSKVPLISAAAIRMEGQLNTFTWQVEHPCYHCISRLFGRKKLSCVESGVMAPLVGVMGALQAMETLKLLTNYGNSLESKILMYDALTIQFKKFVVKKDLNCEVCSHHNFKI
ncbi:molybdopterin biosynthesis protein MoeB [Candidatus Ishikawaella capsulata Mpkobe]|uniref:Molybdopterin biosynthesis protein MoeB n=1 Tax=Candidatus Ishikawaella capsulata Mpkobe TaxID=476281 RepID=C5WCX9_9ENTR|nr:molybdopterin biosynthesis protein MoeB [Candidatus Ishikawaella capsulata Mpkobe]